MFIKNRKAKKTQGNYGPFFSKENLLEVIIFYPFHFPIDSLFLDPLLVSAKVPHLNSPPFLL
jgi:hypothetical protein